MPKSNSKRMENRRIGVQSQGRTNDTLHFAHDMNSTLCGESGKSLTNHTGAFYSHPTACEACKQKITEAMQGKTKGAKDGSG